MALPHRTPSVSERREDTDAHTSKGNVRVKYSRPRSLPLATNEAWALSPAGDGLGILTLRRV